MSLTLRDLYTMASRRFRDIGSPSPEADAERLLEHFFQRDRMYIMLHFSDSFDEARCEGFFEIMDRRANGMPVQYITEQQDFMGLTFKSTEDALIPRQDTEILVEAVLHWLSQKKAPISGFEVLDLCTGSGCIALSLSRLCEKKIHVTALDLSEKALTLAKENATRLGASVKFLQGDLFSPLPLKKSGEGRHLFDCIVSNPPYIPSLVLAGLRPEVKDHEPRMALDGGKSGMDFYERIFREAPSHLRSGGLLALEIGAEQGPAVLSLSHETGAFTPVSDDFLSLLPTRPSSCNETFARATLCQNQVPPYIFKDLAGLDRVYLGIRK